MAESRDGIYLRAATLIRDLITAHLFEDGNKRTAWLVTREYLQRAGETPPPRPDTAKRVLRRIRRYEYGEIAAWLRDDRLDRSRLGP